MQLSEKNTKTHKFSLNTSLDDTILSDEFCIIDAQGEPAPLIGILMATRILQTKLGVM